MVDLNKYVEPGLIIASLKAKTRDDAIKELINRLYSVKKELSSVLPKKTVYEEIINREKMQTTGIGRHMAFPHGRINGWKGFSIVIGISKNGIFFDSIDGTLSHFICLMISSQEEPYRVLQSMAAVIRFIHEERNGDALFHGMTSGEIAASFKRYNKRSANVIIARDIMRPVKVSVRRDTSIEQAVRLMHLHYLDVLPVVDAEDKLCGTISGHDVFSYGMPDFFRQLSTVLFVKYTDPFEKYFKVNKDLKVTDLINEDVTAIAQDATLLEIICDLTIKNKSRIFVVNNGVLVGEINRFNIIDKILFV